MSEKAMRSDGRRGGGGRYADAYPSFLVLI